MDVYFGAQQGFGSEPPNKALYWTSRGGLVVGDRLWSFWKSTVRTCTKGDRVFAVRAPRVWMPEAELRLARTAATLGTLIQKRTYREDVIFTWTSLHWHCCLRVRWEQSPWWAWSARRAECLEITRKTEPRFKTVWFNFHVVKNRASKGRKEGRRTFLFSGEFRNSSRHFTVRKYSQKNGQGFKCFWDFGRKHTSGLGLIGSGFSLGQLKLPRFSRYRSHSKAASPEH